MEVAHGKAITQLAQAPYSDALKPGGFVGSACELGARHECWRVKGFFFWPGIPSVCDTLGYRRDKCPIP